MKKFFAILLALCLLPTMAVFGSEDAAAPSEGESPAGGYRLSGAAGTYVDFFSTALKIGADLYLVLDEDGSGSICFLEAVMPLTWEDGSITIQTDGMNDVPDSFVIPFQYSDGVLQLDSEAYALEFNRLTEEELADFEENGAGGVGSILEPIVESVLGEDLISDLVLGLAFGSMGGMEQTPIPEGEPSEEPVTGVLGKIEYNIVGTDLLVDNGDPFIILYYYATNTSDIFLSPRSVWIEASQDGEFLSEPLERDLSAIIPELNNSGYDLYPGRSILCAYPFAFNPDGGTVSFRISSLEDESILYYYADPQNMTGAPAPFSFDENYTLPEELLALPEKTDHVAIDSMEFYTTEDGKDAIKFSYRYLTNAEEDGVYHACYVLQDGVTLDVIWSEINFEAEGSDARDYPCVLRTDSPVVFLVTEETEDGSSMIMESAMIVEVQ